MNCLKNRKKVQEVLFDQLMSEEMKELMKKMEELMKELEKEGALDMMEQMETKTKSLKRTRQDA